MKLTKEERLKRIIAKEFNTRASSIEILQVQETGVKTETVRTKVKGFVHDVTVKQGTVVHCARVVV